MKNPCSRRWRQRLNCTIALLASPWLLLGCGNVDQRLSTNPPFVTIQEPVMTSGPESINAQTVISLHQTQFGASSEQIKVLVDEAVTWPASNLGCADDGGIGRAVLTPGFRVVLEVGGEQFAYHAGRDRQFFLCNTPE
ncbi:hypothetical protein [Herpetosiphon giganteus]|uniref:hypothetical protein n=1 Tax=Herpetosiphon giganteus TaxID=2029754 RepID=UPI00195DF89C|nr:hypothetical protein [Herpetosiphon giganteus]MBM7846027.1 hypothetical protein [Herpetosiphon giganteus]